MNQHSLSYIKGISFATFSDNELIGMIRYANHPENAYFPSPSGKIILFTKKNTTIDTPPFNTVQYCITIPVQTSRLPQPRYS